MTEIKHEIILTETKELSVTGVDSVLSATKSQIQANTVCGGLVIRGKNLHVEKLDVEAGVLLVNGTVEEMKYVPAKQNFIKRILK